MTLSGARQIIMIPERALGDVCGAKDLKGAREIMTSMDKDSLRKLTEANVPVFGGQLGKAGGSRAFCSFYVIESSCSVCVLADAVITIRSHMQGNTTKSLPACLNLGQGAAVYMPPGWMFAERVVGSSAWIGIRAGTMNASMKLLSDMKWLRNNWCSSDEVLSLGIESLDSVIAARVGQPAQETQEEKKKEGGGRGDATS